MIEKSKIEKFENKFVKIWFKDSLQGKHCLVGIIKKINEIDLIFDINNENYLILLKFENIQYILFK